MSSSEVIELSIDETQALRAKLGLAPLRVGVGGGGSRGGGTNTATSNNPPTIIPTTTNNDGEISLSINDTNALRLKIGLPPLNNNINNNNNNNSSSTTTKKEGSSVATAIHAPPTNTAAESEARQRLEDAQAKRDGRERLLRLEEENRKHAGEGDESALNFAARMMQGGNSAADKEVDADTEKNNNKKRKKKKKKSIKNAQLSIPTEEEEEQQQQQQNSNEDQYTAADLQGIQVSHATSDFTSGSTTILTLADNSILDIDPNSHKAIGFDTNAANNPELINVNMDYESKALDNLKRKRQIELGAGRAGGYAGYDDDEFEELGGVGVVANSLAGAAATRGGNGIGGGNNGTHKSRGFAIGADGTAQATNDTNTKTDLFSTLSGAAVSLESRYGSTTIASDFMSHHDTDENMESKEEKLEKERAKQMKLLDKMRKKKQKMKKKKDRKTKKKRRVQSDEEESDEEEGSGTNLASTGGNSLMASLEATAVNVKSDGNGRKRRRSNDDDDGNMDNEKSTDDADEITAKKDRFDQIMQKGKMRTEKAFQKSAPLSASREMVDDEDDIADDDDAFLNAALAKARRLKRLKDMNGGATPKSTMGEDAIVNAVERIKQEEASANAKENADEATKTTGGGLTFEFDEMQEFTRALRSREDQAKRAAPVRSRGVQMSTSKKEVVVKKEEMDDATDAEPVVDDVDMEEMAQEMMTEDDNNNNNNNNDDGDNQAFGSTAENNGVGRGMSGFLSLLKQTGEIKNSGKEEMRGRAKDKRTYEDYDNLDLKKVVKIDNRNAQEKDIEFANREIKLEYRDDHGRLLTRKEAYRNMCYQFHGHGSGKKHEERRNKQIERERDEGKLASRQVMAEGGVGTLGALKATQKATGKAFIVHKM